MNVEDAMVNMEGSKEGTAARSHDCPSSKEKQNSEKEQENEHI